MDTIVKITTEYIKLDQLLKYEGIAENGAIAKDMIKNGGIFVNGEEERRRGRKIYRGDVVKYKGRGYMVE